MPDYEQTKDLIKKALKQLIKDDLYLIDNSLKEECINHRLAIHLRDGIKGSELDGLNVDIEYDQRIDSDSNISSDPKKDCNGKPIRPDIIIHCRGKHTKNYLAIEAKKGYPTECDKRKIRCLFKEPYNYSYGCLISYFPKRIFPKRNYIKYKICEPNETIEFFCMKYGDKINKNQ